jgi:hypothetical protein
MIRRGLINVVESCFLPTIGSFELLENFKIEIFYNGMELHTSYYRQFFFFFFFFFFCLIKVIGETIILILVWGLTYFH